MSNQYKITRSKDCNIIKSAIDMPIDIQMHHYNVRSVLINLETGDLLTYLLPNSVYNYQGLSRIEHELFFEVEGQKAGFLLKTNHNESVHYSYLKAMEDKGVVFGNEIVADIKGEFSEYDKYLYGEILTHFILDLKDPSHFKILFSDEKGTDQKISMDLKLSYKESELPDVDAELNKYFTYVDFIKLLSWSDDFFENRIKENTSVFREMKDLSFVISNELSLYIDSSRTFKNDLFFTEEGVQIISNRLETLIDNDFNTGLTYKLCERLLDQVQTELMKIRKKENSERAFLNLITLMKHLVHILARID